MELLLQFYFEFRAHQRPVVQIVQVDSCEMHIWNHSQFYSFQAKLLEPRLVWKLHFQLDFILDTDESCIVFGTMLKQKFDDTQLEHLVGFFNRSLTNL